MKKKVSAKPFNLQKKLEDELERLKRLLKMGYELKVVWLPDDNLSLSGEVKGETILIYEEDFDRALETLRHEFLDYEISKIIEPYKEVTNKLISLINEDAYRRKERVIESLSKLL
ncbi:MAG: hypothetical protein QXN40_04075 [Candidatus Bathyarchaeia archaeon]